MYFYDINEGVLVRCGFFHKFTHECEKNTAIIELSVVVVQNQRKFFLAYRCVASCLFMFSSALSQLPFLIFLPFLSLSFVSFSPSSVFFPSIFPFSVLPFFPDLSLLWFSFPLSSLTASISSISALLLLPCVLFLFLLLFSSSLMCYAPFTSGSQARVWVSYIYISWFPFIATSSFFNSCYLFVLQFFCHARKIE